MSGARYYVWRNGDNFTKVAIQLYGDASKWRLLADINGVRDPRNVPIGTRLKY